MKSLSAEILCVGYELLSGAVVNTNAHWLSQKIFELGGFVKRITVIGDDVNEIDRGVREAITRRPNWLILSGGLGPTYDDKTLEGVALGLELELAVNEYAVSMLKRNYALQSKNYELDEIRLKMARIPFGSKPLQNPIGSAPGVLIENDGTRIVCLPGVPQEMKAIFMESIIPSMKKEVGDFYIVESNYDVEGVSEAMLAAKIFEMMQSSSRGSLYLKTHPLGHTTDDNKKQPRLLIQMITKGENESEAQRIADTVSGIMATEISLLKGTITGTLEKKFHN